MKKRLSIVVILFYFSIQFSSASKLDSIRYLAETAPFPERLEHMQQWYWDTPNIFEQKDIDLFNEGISWLDNKKNKTEEELLQFIKMRVQTGFMYSDTEQIGKLFKTASKVVTDIDSIGIKTNPWIKQKGRALFQIYLFYDLEVNPTKGIKYLERSYECAKEIEDKNQMARILNSMGNTAIALNDFEKALEYSQESVELYQELNNTYGILRAKLYVARTLIHLEKYEEAKNILLAILPIMRTEKHNKLSSALLHLGNSYTHLGYYKAAEKSINEGLNLSKSRGLRTGVANAYLLIAQLKEKTGNYKSALIAERQFKIYNDSTLLQSQDQKLKKEQAKFDNAEKEQKIKELEQTTILEKAKARNRFLTLLSITLILLGAFLFWFFRQRQKIQHNKILLDKEKEIALVKEKLFANITHDLRTPLSLIINPLEEIIPNTQNPQTKEQLNLALNNGQQLARLVDQVLDWQRIEAKVMKLSPYQGDLVQAIKSCIRRHHVAADRKNIQLNTTSSEEIKIINLDFDKLDKIISNLLSNALKATPEGGKIKIDLTIDQTNFQLKISDTGYGIPKEKQTEIFERFNTQSNDTWGVSIGIGLSLVRELTTLMKGKVHLESIPKQGSHFTIDIPYEEATANTNLIPSHRKDDHQQINLLIVEDHTDMAKHIVNLLSNGYKSSIASNAVDGLALALKNIPDIIITDLGLPGKNGHELCVDLKSNMLTDHIPILILTAHTDEAARLQGLKVRADAFLTKPFKTEELRYTLTNLLQNRRRLKMRYSAQAKEIGKETDPFVGLIMKTIEQNYTNNKFNVDSFAKKMHFSRAQLFKKTKALLDTSPSQIIKQFRLEKSRQLLQEGKSTVSEVAYNCGFSSPEYFSSVYKEYFKRSPNEEKKLSKI